MTFDSKEAVIDYIHKNEIVETKFIINSDLIVTSNYNDLAEYQNVDFDIYQLKFYGEDKYFISYEQAWNYIQNHVNYRVINYDGNTNSFTFGEHKFFKEEEFTNWINQNIVEVNANDIPRKQEVF